MKKLLAIALVMTMTVLSAPETRAAAINIEVPATTFAISKLGDVTVVLSEGVFEAIVASGQKFTGEGIYFSINGISYPADALLTSNLTLQRDTMPQESFSTIGASNRWAEPGSRCHRR